ncbi:MAG TPA: SIMPL domain-containing protein [Polyangiaceae bacterium]|nr:SIMPL domain-containing protein [Polyangiaceae bacterium]
MATLSFRRWSTALTLLGATALVTLSGCGHKPRTANLTIKTADRTITVVGRSEVASKPDVARANMGVEVGAPTVGEAMNLARTRMTSLMDALKKLGIAEKDIRTSNFSIHFERSYQEPMPMPMPEAAGAAPAAPPPAGPRGRGAAAAGPAPAAPPPLAVPMMQPPQSSGVYRVSNTVEVVIRDLARVSTVLDAAVAAGANNMWGINFGLDETSGVEAKARELAAADAKKRAESLARLSGVSIGPVVSVSEVVGSVGMPMPMAAQAARMDGGGGTPVSPGEVTFTAQLQVVYSIVSLPAPELADEEGD